MPDLLRARVLSVDGQHATVVVDGRAEPLRASVADIAASTGLPALELPGLTLEVWAGADEHFWGWQHSR
ncbi:hypothetical protein ACFO4E_28175 [Nocardiopsis mangrovi]|uniref:Uncharacterized protein n=1 Tax=Nocardiopsis mangrovi TaxID=1179818 RepID=A0ABV9E7V8_9ACTN